MNAHCVILLKVSPDPKGFQSTLQAYSFSAQKTENLPIGTEMFHELCSLTLKKEGSGLSLLLENLKTGPVTKDVDMYLNKKINRCLSEIIWSSSGPGAVLAVFFEGTYRTISQDELHFIKSIVSTLSFTLENLELKESFQQAAVLFKPLGSALKKFALPFGNQIGLAPCIMILEPKMSTIKGYKNIDAILGFTSIEQAFSNKDLTVIPPSSVSQPGPKGQALAQALAMKNDTNYSSPTSETRFSGVKLNFELMPMECFEVLNDFGSILDGLADKFSLKRPKRLGLQVHIS